MKKKYQAPQVNMIVYGDAIMEGALTVESVGVSGHGNTGAEDLDAGFGGNGGSGQRVDAKGNGRGFWDDEE